MGSRSGLGELGLTYGVVGKRENQGIFKSGHGLGYCLGTVWSNEWRMTTLVNGHGIRWKKGVEKKGKGLALGKKVELLEAIGGMGSGD